MSETYSNCIKDYVKYSDTVTVLAAIKDVLVKNPNIGQFIGVERTITTKKGDEITPDICALYDQNGAGILFELKWAVSPKTIKDELLNLKRYFDARYKLLGYPKIVGHNDVILVCHVDDANAVVKAIEELIKTPENDFLKSEGFVVWAWMMVHKKQTGRDALDEMRLECEYGKARNKELERSISEPGGIIVSSDVLTHLRSIYLFTKEKPPVQYMMGVLFMHVFSAFQRTDYQEQTIDLRHVNIEDIYTFMKNLFPGWHDATAETVQAKKGWIKEGIEKFIRLKFSITLPYRRIRKPPYEWICEKLQYLQKRTGVRSHRGRYRPRTSTGFKRIDEFIH